MRPTKSASLNAIQDNYNMLKQNYINIFENAGGNITIAYASCGDDPFQIEDVQSVSIEKEDLHAISGVLKDLAESFDREV